VSNSARNNRARIDGGEGGCERGVSRAKVGTDNGHVLPAFGRAVGRGNRSHGRRIVGERTGRAEKPKRERTKKKIEGEKSKEERTSKKTTKEAKNEEEGKRTYPDWSLA
jgi:hypothetical protein